MTAPRHSRFGALMAAIVLVSAACSSAAVNDTTTGEPPPTQSVTTVSTTSATVPTPSTTRPPTTSSSTAITPGTSATTPPTTTSTTEAASTTSTTIVVADVVAMGTFDFASGADPQVKVTVEAGTAQDGTWLAAGFGQNPDITGPDLWIRFTIENLDFRGPITEFDISGTEDEPLGQNVCPDQAPVAASAVETCIVGPLAVVAGPQSIGFSVTASGEGQPIGNGEWLTPPLEPPGYLGAPTSFLFAFETNELPREGLLIEGRASGTTVDVDLPGELVATISVECASPGAGSGLTLLAHSITTYDADGTPTGGCDTIPTVTLNYTLDGLSDTEVNYTGG